MRIAYLPLDSRPANWQFPQRLADIAGVDLLLPERRMLGTLHTGADRRELARWLRQHAREADAVVFAWDTLLYGGLVQSRDPELPAIDPAEIEENLASVDWTTTAGYAFSTIPRLGITTAASSLLDRHEAVRELFIAAGDADNQPAEPRLTELSERLGPALVEQLFDWRRRNQANLLSAADVSARLGLRRLHVAVEDNAPRGPHLDELRQLQARRLALLHDGYDIRLTSFDGADECGCLLLARAILDLREAERLPVQLTVHPPSPGAQNYRGLFESNNLQDGLEFLEKFLGFHFTSEPAEAQWLVVHGIQPQPDAFSGDPARLFGNPYVLPAAVPGRGGLFVTDLAVCNAANPDLAYRLAEIAGGSLGAIVGFNTNFNSLGVTAALLALGHGRTAGSRFRRFALERLADDVVYQAIARPEVIAFLRSRGLDPLDFGGDHATHREQCSGIVDRVWQAWVNGRGSQVLAAMNLEQDLARQVEFDFPWRRAFEIEATAPAKADRSIDPS